MVVVKKTGVCDLCKAETRERVSGPARMPESYALVTNRGGQAMHFVALECGAMSDPCICAACVKLVRTLPMPPDAA